MNRTSLLILFILTFTLGFVAFAQIDSLALRNECFHKSDSLIEIGQYEKARDFLSVGRAFQPIAGQTKSSRKVNAEYYLGRKSKIDVLITYHLTDSVRYLYRIERGHEFLGYGAYSYAAHYFTDAQKYAKGKLEAEIELGKIIQSYLADTVVIDAYNNGNLQLLQKKSYYQQPDVLVPFNGMKKFFQQGNRLDTLYFRKDSLQFNGVIVFIQLSNYLNQSGRVEVYNFESGLPVLQTVHHLCGSEEGSENSQRILNKYTFDGYYCGRSDDWGAREFYLYPNGDTLMKKETISDGSYTIRYHPNGDTALFSTRKPLDSLSFFGESTKWSLDRRVIEYEESVDSLYETLWWVSIKVIDGDTVFYERVEADKRQGRFVDNYMTESDSLITLESLWSDNRLLDILNTDVLYFDDKFKLIDELAFFGKVDNDISNSPLYLFYPFTREVKLSGNSYRFIAYPYDVWEQGENRWKKITKAIEKLEMKVK